VNLVLLAKKLVDPYVNLFSDIKCMGYYVSEEAEKAALWDKSEKRKELRRKVGNFEDDCRVLSEKLATISRILANPKAVKFTVLQDSVLVTAAGSGEKVEIIEKEHTDFTRIAALLADLEGDRKRLDEVNDIPGL
jgi:hypothetical protein